jgi:hypothetical protein
MVLKRPCFVRTMRLEREIELEFFKRILFENGIG